jgi:hypothetical protein
MISLKLTSIQEINTTPSHGDCLMSTLTNGFNTSLPRDRQYWIWHPKDQYTQLTNRTFPLTIRVSGSAFINQYLIPLVSASPFSTALSPFSIASSFSPSTPVSAALFRRFFAVDFFDISFPQNIIQGPYIRFRGWNITLPLLTLRRRPHLLLWLIPWITSIVSRNRKYTSAFTGSSSSLGGSLVTRRPLVICPVEDVSVTASRFAKLISAVSTANYGRSPQQRVSIFGSSTFLNLEGNRHSFKYDPTVLANRTAALSLS